MKMNINKNDFEILNILTKEKFTISELSRAIEIAPVNLWRHLTKLKELEIIKIPDAKKGKKKYPGLVNKEKVEDFLKSYMNLIGV